MRRSSLFAVLGAGLLLLLLTLAAWRWWPLRYVPGPPPTIEQVGRVALPAYVGRTACAECHQVQDQLFKGSHHDLAMDVADELTVLGDFNDAIFSHEGVTSTFSRRDGAFLVETEGPDGTLHEYEIKYVFGVTPLQQYLIEFPGGRLQTLGIAWDSRPVEAGGQRWFHLYPNERLEPGDPLHWTGRSQNWNYMCAECHSTDLRKNYDLGTDGYQTAWEEIDVSCEACHGPGAEHVRWARAVAEGTTPAEGGSMGLAVRLKESDGGEWILDTETGNAKRSVPRTSHAQIETCARCHSRRGQINGTYVHGKPLLDTHRLATLDPGLYHPDGQILDEVYVYGSFIQSKMYHEGVTCSDCHDPHSLKVNAPGNALCSRCHLPDRYDTPAHHFHEADGPGSQCVSCHMPTKTYMVVDPRLDHSMRVPRPDLSVRLGTPNACTACHTEESAEWAADAVATWYGPDRRQEHHYGEAIALGRSGAPGAEQALIELVGNRSAPGIARATAATLLGDFVSPRSLPALELALRDPDPLVRQAAVAALEGLGPANVNSLIAPLLEDPVRVVRMEAARVLGPLPAEQVVSPREGQTLQAAVREYVDSLMFNADQPESHVMLGNFALRCGDRDRAEASYRMALRLDPRSVPARVNLADFYRGQQRDDLGEGVLREAIEIEPMNAMAHHTLGLLLARQRKTAEALEELQLAAQLDPENARFGYVYGVALDSSGQKAQALVELEQCHWQHPYDRDILVALVTFHREAGREQDALEYARRLLELSPQDPGYHQLVESLQLQPGGQ